MQDVSFHCMICFEGFDAEKRHPVVLPCGHTYVCKMCAERLDKCMECRTPLYMTIPRTAKLNNQNHDDSNTAASYHLYSSSRYSTRSPRYPHHDPVTPKTAPQPPIKRRLPLPKNAVLLSLMEAGDLVCKDITESDQQQQSLTGSSESLDAAMTDPDDIEEQKIRQGASMAVGESGTYAVAAKQGLEIYPTGFVTPKDTDAGSDCDDGGACDCQKTSVSEQDVDSLVRYFHLENKLEIQHSPSKEDREGVEVDNESDGGNATTPVVKEPVTKLNCGDRVQIVAIQGGWAKLARGYGYLRCDKSQLVKVGNPLDKACRLEAFLRSLSIQNRKLKQSRIDIESRFESTMKELQSSLVKDEDMTIVVSSHKNDEDADGSISSAIGNVPEEQASVAEEKEDFTQSWNSSGNSVSDQTPLKPRFTEPPQSPPEDSPSFFCSAEVFRTVMPSTPSLPTYAPELPIADALGASQGSGSSSQILLSTGSASPGSSSSASTSSSNSSAPAHQQQIFRSNTLPVLPSTTPAARPRSGYIARPPSTPPTTQVWREMRERPIQTVGVDFRTGMSGHFGLQGSSSRPHDLMESARSRAGFLRMSNHTGLTMWKPTRRRSISGHYASDDSFADISLPQNVIAASFSTTRLQPRAEPQSTR